MWPRGDFALAYRGPAQQLSVCYFPTTSNESLTGLNQQIFDPNIYYQLELLLRSSCLGASLSVGI